MKERDEARRCPLQIGEDGEAALQRLPAEDRRYYLEANREAIEAYNMRIEREGAFGDDVRLF